MVPWIGRRTLLQPNMQPRNKRLPRTSSQTSRRRRPRGKRNKQSSAAGGSKAADKSGGSGGRIIMQEFAPSFAMSEGRIISVNDSVKLEPGLAPTMLRGLVLSNEMEKVPQELQPSLVHASAYIVQAEREKSRSYKGSLKTAKAQIVELEKEKDEIADK
ncbi:hypothetical protein RHMOL_Rhmol01G0110200 [Rhododendron molle]|uniref:Uncharacterized protein n=1 Tax=Rhododendron molle TaxID=49168 RepID=A0ACC0Q363_RHOML|nr:hypothetical protein RHMOL_Rhmol01G0110200 [Rhododendron molle]